jgi:hypothetical protein
VALRLTSEGKLLLVDGKPTEAECCCPPGPCEATLTCEVATASACKGVLSVTYGDNLCASNPPGLIVSIDCEGNCTTDAEVAPDTYYNLLTIETSGCEDNDCTGTGTRTRASTGVVSGPCPVPLDFTDSECAGGVTCGENDPECGLQYPSTSSTYTLSEPQTIEEFAAEAFPVLSFPDYAEAEGTCAASRGVSFTPETNEDGRLALSVTALRYTISVPAERLAEWDVVFTPTDGAPTVTPRSQVNGIVEEIVPTEDDENGTWTIENVRCV